ELPLGGAPAHRQLSSAVADRAPGLPRFPRRTGCGTLSSRRSGDAPRRGGALAENESSHAARRFPRRVDALGEIFEFIEGFFAKAATPRGHLLPVQLVVEELFTNQIKYAAGGTKPILLDLARSASALSVSLTDFDVEPFDVRSAPEARTDAPLEERRPGG